MKEDRGKLLHKMPNNIYYRNLKYSIFEIILTFIGLTLVFMLMIFILLSIWHNEIIFNAGSIFAVLLLLVIFIFVLITLLHSLYRKLKEGLRMIRFRVYEDGFVPTQKPMSYYFINRLHLIPFKEIMKIEFKNSGFLCKQTLKNGDTLEISIDSHSPKNYDIEGYLKLMNLLQNKFPKEKYPDIEAVKKYLCMKEEIVDDKI